MTSDSPAPTAPATVEAGGLTLRLTHAPAQHRFLAETLDASGAPADRIGFASYHDAGGERIFDHTVTHPQHEGRGVAAALVRYALDETVAEGKRIVPVCSYVVDFVRTRHDWDSHLA